MKQGKKDKRIWIAQVVHTKLNLISQYKDLSKSYLKKISKAKEK